MSEYPEEDQFHQRIDFKLWRDVFKHALAHKHYVYGIIFWAIVIAVCDAAFALVTRWAVDDAIELGSATNAWKYIAVYMGLTSVFVVGVWKFIVKAGSLSNHMSHDIRSATFERIQELEFAYFDHRPTGWMISRLTSDCDKLSRIIAWGCLDLVWAFFLIVAISIILLVMSPLLGAIVLMVIPPLVWVSSFFQKKLLLSSRKTRQFNSMITASFSEGLQGLKTSKTFVQEDRNQGDFEKLSDQMYFHSLRNAIQSAVYMPIVLSIGSVATGVVIWVGGGQYLSEALTLGTLVAFIFYTGQFFHPVHQIAQILVELQGAQAAGERVLGLLAAEPQIVDSEEVLARLEKHSNSHEPGIAPDGLPDEVSHIEFRNVTFWYKENEPIVEDFNLTVEPGQTIALVGESGGGKSTLISLLSRFYEPSKGGIYINGFEYRERSLDWYQSNLGIVLQTPELFAGTIADNIRYGRLDATDEEVILAARQVNAHHFIVEMDKGYHTEVGESGGRLSTGQKQLISFARAILASPQIFIMDEATSSIDTETETMIQAGLRSIFEGRISFVIAHRLSTIRSADRILVINKGKIIEDGNHAELIASRGHYFELYTRQFTQFEETSFQ